MIETKNFLKDLFELFIIVTRTLQEDSGILHGIRGFVGAHREGLQSLNQRTTVNFSTYIR